MKMKMKMKNKAAGAVMKIMILLRSIALLYYTVILTTQ